MYENKIIRKQLVSEIQLEVDRFTNDLNKRDGEIISTSICFDGLYFIVIITYKY